MAVLDDWENVTAGTDSGNLFDGYYERRGIGGEEMGRHRFSKWSGSDGNGQCHLDCEQSI